MKQTGPIYNTKYKLYTNSAGVDFYIGNGDLALERLSRQGDAPLGTGKFQFGKVTREEFEALPDR